MNKHQLLQIAIDLVETPYHILASQSRIRKYVYDRHIVMYLLSSYTALTHNEIGLMLNRNRSAVTYAVKSVNNMKDTDRHSNVKLRLIEESYKDKIIIQKDKKSIMIKKAIELLSQEGYNVSIP